MMILHKENWRLPGGYKFLNVLMGGNALGRLLFSGSGLPGVWGCGRPKKGLL